MVKEDEEYLILAEGLTRIYRTHACQVPGVNGVDLRIRSGEMVVLKGNSGSGKSTLLALLAGLDHPTAGRLIVAGHDLPNATAQQLTRFRREVVGMVFQSFNLMPTLTVLENVCLPALLAGKSQQAVEPRALELLAWLGMSSRLQHMPSQLSGGEMQRTAIARALINQPSLVLADEPTGNLDSRNGRIVVELLTELNRQFGCTLIIATHSTLADPWATRQIQLEDGMISPSH
jgi:ABC-type lipoprotein export system ATPase subunit